MVSGVKRRAATSYFTEDDVVRLTGLSRRQLGYWDRTGFFTPENRRTGGATQVRLYSFRDVAGLKTIARLRQALPLQELRKVGKWLRDRHDEPWARLRFYIWGRSVYFNDPMTSRLTAARPLGQTARPELIKLDEIVADLAGKVEELRRRPASALGAIEKHRTLLHNEDVISGTRIPTAAIFEFSRAGCSAEQIIDEYPRLTRRDVEAAIEHEKHKRVA
jgi:DNA-binding transcriptional MerR regulator